MSHIYIVSHVMDNSNHTVAYMTVDIDKNNEIKRYPYEKMIEALQKNKLQVMNKEWLGNNFGIIRNADTNKYNGNCIVVINDKEDRQVGCICDRQLGLSVSVMDKSTIESLSDTYKIVYVSSDESSDIPEKIKRDACNKENASIESYELTAEDKEVWDIAKFKKYMDKNGWDYLIESYVDNAYKIMRIDPECTVLHLPKEVVYVNLGCIGQRANKLRKIVFGPKITAIDSLYTNKQTYKTNAPDTEYEMDRLDVVYFQHEDGYKVGGLDAPGLYCLNIGYTNLPSSVGMSNAFNNCNIEHIDFEDSLVENYVECFNKTEFEQHITLRLHGEKFRTVNLSFNEAKFNFGVDIDTFRKIHKSFGECVGDMNVKIADHTSEIGNSFNKCTGLNRLVGTQTSALHMILSSFCDTPVQNVCIGNTEYITISDSFNNCNQLKKIGLPTNLTRLAHSFISCAADFVDLTQAKNFLSLQFPLFSENTLLEIGPGFSEISGSITEDIDQNVCKLQFDSDNLGFGHGVYSCNKIENIEDIEKYGINLAYVKDLQANAFTGCTTDIVDLGVFPNVHELNEDTFNNAKIDTVIIRDNIVKVNKQCFGMNEQAIHNIIIDSNVDIKALSFSKRKQSIRTRLFIHRKNEKALKSLGTSVGINRQYIIIVVESIDEALEQIYGKKENKSDRALIDMTLRGTEYEALLDDKYIGSAKQAYKLLAMYDKDVDNCPVEVDLRYPKVPAREVGIQWEDTANSQNAMSSGRAITRGRFTFSDKKVRCLCNLVMNIFEDSVITYWDDKFTGLKGNEGTDEDDGKYVIDKPWLILKSSEYKLIVVTGHMEKASIHSLRILYIVDSDNNIVFMAWTRRVDFINLTGNDFNSDREHFSIAPYLEIGNYNTKYDSEGYTVGKIKIPMCAHADNMMDSFFDSLLMFDGESSRFDKDHSWGTFNVYDILSGYMFKVEYGQFARDAFIIKDKYKMGERGSIGESENFRKFNESDIKWLNYWLAYKQRDLLDKMQDSHNYTRANTMELEGLANRFYHMGIKSADQLDSKSAELLYNSSLYTTLGEAVGKIKADKVERVYRLTDTRDTIVIENVYHGAGGEELVVNGLLNRTTSLKDASILKIGVCPLAKMVQVLYCLGLGLANSDRSQACNGITNRRINIDNFVHVSTHSLDDSDSVSSCGLKLNLMIDKRNADVYIIGENLDTDFIPIYRCKDLVAGSELLYGDTMELRSAMIRSAIKDGKVIPASLFGDYKGIHKKLMQYVLTDTDETFTDYALESFRSDIIRGYPDGYLSSSHRLAVMSVIYYLDKRVLRQQGVKHVAQYEG